MRDRAWLAKYATAGFVAVLASRLSVAGTGYGLEGLLAGMELTLFFIFTASYVLASIKLYSSRLLLNPIPIQGFDAERNIRLVDLLIFRSNPSQDYLRGIYFQPILASSNFINPLFLLSVTYLFCSSTIHFLVRSFTLTNTDYFFLMIQSWIVYVFSLLVFMVVVQLPNIYRFLIIQSGINPDEATIMKLLRDLLGIKEKPVGLPGLGMRTVSATKIPQDTKEVLAPAIELLNRNKVGEFINLYDDTRMLKAELASAIKEFNVSDSYFADDIALVSDILDGFYPDVVAKSKKTLSNTRMIEQIKEAFQNEMEDSIFSNVALFKVHVRRSNEKIMTLRLSAFDTSGVDQYIQAANKLHNKIKSGSGEWSNQHLVISTSVVTDLLPSLIKSWSLSTSADEKQIVIGQFKDLVAFLEKQLSTLKGTLSEIKQNAKAANNGSLELNNGAGNTELGAKIARDTEYLKSLEKHWN